MTNTCSSYLNQPKKFEFYPKYLVSSNNWPFWHDKQFTEYLLEIAYNDMLLSDIQKKDVGTVGETFAV